jgi:hypothetical protein
MGEKMVDVDMSENDVGLFAPAKNAQAVFQELLYDWPPISLADAKTMSNEILVEKVRCMYSGFM